MKARPLIPCDGNLGDVELSLLEKRASESETSDSGATFSLEELTDGWKTKGTRYGTIDLSKTLLSSATQDVHARNTAEAIKNNKYGVGSMPAYFALFESLYDNRENSRYSAKIEGIRKFLQESFPKWLMTLTRIKYKSSGQDEVIHEYGLPSQHAPIKENIVGPDELVKNTSTKSRYKALTGSDNVQKINDVLKWITGKEAYGWFINGKPETDTDRVARFLAGSVTAGLACYWARTLSSSGLGVRYVREARRN